MRTQAEIVARYKESMARDLLGFERDEYLLFLDYEHAKEFLKPEMTQEIWEKCTEKRDPKTVMREYMPFAKEKAKGQHGILASRSMSHYRAWLWLEGHDSLSDVVSNYEDYGIANLKLICEFLSIKWEDQ